MREALIGIIVAIASLVTTKALTWWARLLCALAAAAIAVAVSLFLPGCMSTADVDGKVYSWRLDILAPIGATVPKPEWEDTRPIIINTAPLPAPTSQPTEVKHGS